MIQGKGQRDSLLTEPRTQDILCLLSQRRHVNQVPLVCANWAQSVSRPVGVHEKRGKNIGTVCEKCSRRTYLGLLCEWEGGHAHGGHCQSCLLRTYGLCPRCVSVRAVDLPVPNSSRGVSQGLAPTARTVLTASQLQSLAQKVRKNASSRETWWRTIYLAEKCVSHRFHLDPNRGC